MGRTVSKPIPTEVGDVSVTVERRGISRPAEALATWLFFTVLISLLPIIGAALGALTEGPGKSLVQLVGKGELLLVAVSILAAAVGELLAEASITSLLRQALVGSAFIVMAIGILWFGIIATAVEVNTAGSVRSDVVGRGSELVFLTSVVIGGCCIAQSGRGR